MDTHKIQITQIDIGKTRKYDYFYVFHIYELLLLSKIELDRYSSPLPLKTAKKSGRFTKTNYQRTLKRK